VPKLTEWMSFEKQQAGDKQPHQQQSATARAKAQEAGTRRAGAIALKVNRKGWLQEIGWGDNGVS